MINFRYHVVSLVAVFLALSVGALVGGSFIKEGTVDVLRATLRNLKDTTDELTQDVRELERSNGTLNEFARAGRESLVRGTLTNRPVLLFSFSTTPDDVVREVAATLQLAGGRIEGWFKMSDNLDGTTEARRGQIAQALEATAANEEELRALLVLRLTDSLSGKQPGILQRLIVARLVEAESLEGVQPKRADSLAAPGTALVIISGKAGRDSALEQRLILPLIRALAEAPAVVLVGELDTDALGLAGPLRDDPALRLVTVDGVAGPVGQTGVALGLAAALGGRFGHYGSGEGAASLLPGQP